MTCWYYQCNTAICVSHTKHVTFHTSRVTLKCFWARHRDVKHGTDKKISQYIAIHRYTLGSRVISRQRLVNIHQLEANLKKNNNIFWASNKQSRYWNWFFVSWRLHLRRYIFAAWCDEYVMIHYNRNNNVHCRAVNAETFMTNNMTISQYTISTTHCFMRGKPKDVEL